MTTGWSFLSGIYEILRKGNVLNTPDSEQVVEFKHPEELKQILDTSIDSPDPITENDIEEICKRIIKYSVKTGHPNFCNQLFGGIDPYCLAGSWITDAMNTSQYTFEVSPVFTLIEDVVIKKTLNLIGFENGDGIFSPGGSISNMYAMVLARFQIVPNIKVTGLFGIKPLVVFTSEDAHYSIKKSVHWLGIGTDNLIIVKTDEGGCMLVDDLEDKINVAFNNGQLPFFVNATAGTTVLGAFDDINNISIICKKYNLWLHVDACLGGTAILSKKYKFLLNGINKIDSLSWNPHKTLGVLLQCSMFLIKQKGLLHECNSANAQYLFQKDKFYDTNYDTGDKSIQCGRKVDAFKLWIMFKARGMNEIERLVDNAIQCAEFFCGELKKRIGFRLVLEKFQYTNVCFWYIPKHMRNMNETNEWWNQIYKIAPLLKERMITREKPNMMIGYTPLLHKNKGNFFRMVTTCHPPPTEKTMLFIIDEIEKLGDEL